MSGDTVLNRVEVDIIHVGGVVGVVAYCVFPIPSLPYASLALADEGRAAVLRMRDAP